MTVYALVGRCACGRPARQFVDMTPYCVGCLPSGVLRFDDARRLFRLLINAGIARSTANVMLIAKLEFDDP